MPILTCQITALHRHAMGVACLAWNPRKNCCRADAAVQQHHAGFVVAVF